MNEQRHSAVDRNASVARSRLSAVNGQIHTAATTLKTAKGDLGAVNFEHAHPKQLEELRHAAMRAAVHARALLDAINDMPWMK